MIARQGHRYKHKGTDVLAMSNSVKGEPCVKVSEINSSRPYPLSESFLARVEDLTPLPMVYFHGQVPA
jgi:hypothetical protein